MSGGGDECLGLIVRDLVFVNIECFHRLQMPRFFIERVLFPIFWANRHLGIVRHLHGFVDPIWIFFFR